MGYRSGQQRLFDGVELAQDQFSAAFALLHMDDWGLAASWTDTTPSAGTTFTTDFATDDQLDSTAHGLVQEQKVQVSTATTLPSPLATATDYWVIFIDANTLELAATLADARSGTQIDITDDGTGVHTITAQAISVTLTVQYADTRTPVAADWLDSALNVVIDDTPLSALLEDSAVGHRWMRLSTVVGTGGSGLLTADVNAKGGA